MRTSLDEIRIKREYITNLDSLKLVPACNNFMSYFETEFHKKLFIIKCTLKW